MPAQTPVPPDLPTIEPTRPGGWTNVDQDGFLMIDDDGNVMVRATEDGIDCGCGQEPAETCPDCGGDRLPHLFLQTLLVRDPYGIEHDLSGEWDLIRVGDCHFLDQWPDYIWEFGCNVWGFDAGPCVPNYYWCAKRRFGLGPYSIHFFWWRGCVMVGEDAWPAGQYDLLFTHMSGDWEVLASGPALIFEQGRSLDDSALAPPTFGVRDSICRACPNLKCSEGGCNKKYCSALGAWDEMAHSAWRTIIADGGCPLGKF